MKRILFALLIALALIPIRAGAEGEILQRLYLVPTEVVPLGAVNARGPEYFAWRYDQNPPSISTEHNNMDYGFLPYMLVFCPSISATDHASLIAHADVYAFPDNLDAPITDANLKTFFETINIPTDWLTPSTTYREFLRNMAGMFQFNQRYGAISGGQSLLGNGIVLDSNWNSLSANQKDWFNATVTSFGYTYTVAGNPKLRVLAKRIGDFWGTTPFYMGAFSF